MKTGKKYRGILCRDTDADIDEFLSQDARFTFTETLPQPAGSRNPRVFDGKLISITLQDNGSLRPNFKAMPEGMSAGDYAFEVYMELRQALRGLVEEE